MELVGRESELREIAVRLAAGARSGSALVLVGEPGIGTTSLLDAAATMAGRGGRRVVAVSLSRFDAGVPLAGLHRVTRALGAGPLVFSDEPLLITVDGLQWLDVDSRAALATAARTVSVFPVVLIGATRTGSPGIDGATELHVGPLDDVSADHLLSLADADLDPALRGRIRADAAGNPLALRELPIAWRSLAAPGADLLHRLPPVTEALRHRATGAVRVLPPDTATTLLVAALDLAEDCGPILAAAGVLAAGADAADGSAAGVPTAAGVGGPGALSVGVLDPAVAAGFVTVVEGRVRFASTTIRAAVVAAAAPGLVRTAHLALAGVLAGEPRRAGWHRAAAGTPAAEDVGDLLVAGISAAEPVDALRRLVRAAVGTARMRRLIAAAGRAYELGRPDLGGHLLDTALAGGATADDRVHAQAVRLRFAAQPQRAPQPLEPLVASAERFALAGEVDAALDVLLAAAYTMWCADPGAAVGRQVCGVLDVLDDLSGQEGDRDPRIAAVRAVAASAAGLPCSTVVGFGERDPDVCWLHGFAALSRGDTPLAADLLGAAAVALRASGRVGLLVHVQGLFARAAVPLGDWVGAEAAAAECLRLATATDQPVWQAQALVSAALVAALRGETDFARRWAAQAELVVSGRRLPVVSAGVRLARTVALLSEESYADAWDLIRQTFDSASAHRTPLNTADALSYLAEAAVHCGRVAEARELVEACGTGDAPALTAGLFYARALLAGEPDAEERFAQARSADLSAWPWLVARIDFAWGSRLRRNRRVVECRAPLHAAWHTFDLLGARTWANRVRAELRAAGVGAPAVDPLTGRLSPQELQIAQLAAVGLSNREIGQRLFLSPRTIGSHLYRIFPKLGVTSRSQLASVVAVPVTAVLAERERDGAEPALVTEDGT